jgi:hypothetical protein
MPWFLLKSIQKNYASRISSSQELNGIFFNMQCNTKNIKP